MITLSYKIHTYILLRYNDIDYYISMIIVSLYSKSEYSVCNSASLISLTVIISVYMVSMI